MNVTVNGNPQTLDDRSTVLDLLASLGIEESSKGVAVAVNGELASRSEWRGQTLVDGDSVEVLRPMQGG